ncbi:MAG: hypothetical protein QOE59_1333, partial [Actinomycetota bacterium]|nr:hypothetical protein [Actinomycetota bacterium]
TRPMLRKACCDEVVCGLHPRCRAVPGSGRRVVLRCAAHLRHRRAQQTRQDEVGGEDDDGYWAIPAWS